MSKETFYKNNRRSIKDIPLDVIKLALKDNNWELRLVAMNACQGRDIPLEVIEHWLNDNSSEVRQVAMNACKGKNVPLDVIQRWLNDGDCYARQAAMNACQGRDIPLDIIECGLEDVDCNVRCAAMNACRSMDIPLDVIEHWLKDTNYNVRHAAVCYCEQKGIEIPTIRTIEPPEKVYKKCLNDVIVVATIPYDAEVRGSYKGKCRTNKAKIIDIIGDFYGEKIGISNDEYTTAYFIGDEIVIDNFNKSFEEDSTGFHFFCTREQAENYD